ncbi:hypothetical protein ACKVMT_13905 [Halobacteriales archaeon Cl-PHB]
MSRRTWGDRATDLATSPWPWLGAAFLLVVGAVVAVVVKPTIPSGSVPRIVKVGAVGTIAAGALGYLPTAKVLDWLYDPPKRYLVCPGLTEDVEPGVWELTPQEYADLEVVGGQLYEWPSCEHPTYEVQDYYPDLNRAVGTWRGTATDSQMIR